MTILCPGRTYQRRARRAKVRTMEFVMTTHASAEIRDHRFGLCGVPRYWHGGKRAGTLFFNNLSIFFPPGERLFVAAVKAHRDAVTDPKLREEVRAFCAQEGFHGREHVRYNRMQREQGYPVDETEKRVERRIAGLSQRLPQSWDLA